MQGRVTPETVTKLETGQIFVFGSNLRGIHGAGAALAARKQFGAKLGIGEGFTGECYALPTKRTPYKRATLEEIHRAVDLFIETAQHCRGLTFLVVEVGCKLAGYTPAQIAPLFRPAIKMQNVWLPASFWRVLSPARTGTQ